MTDLAAADVTITVEQRRIIGKQRRNRCKIAFGDGALTIPSGGVPMPGYASFGMTRNLDYLTVFDENDASGILWKYDKDNNKLRAYNAPAQTHSHNLLLISGGVPSGAAGVNGQSLVVSGGANVTVSGGSTASGGVQTTTLAAAVLTEDVSSAPAAQTLYCEAVGW